MPARGAITEQRLAPGRARPHANGRCGAMALIVRKSAPPANAPAMDSLLPRWLARSLARGGPRRGVLKTLAAGALGGGAGPRPALRRSQGSRRVVPGLVILVLAAVITPTTDPVNMMVVAVPLYMLYEAGVIVARLFARRPVEPRPRLRTRTSRV